MSILITGGTGQLGRELVGMFPGCLHPTHKELDITNSEAVLQLIENHRPQTLIHTAAVARIVPCENDKQGAWKTNVEGTRHLVESCQTYANDCYFVYISTACVFHGDRGNYTEEDMPYPKNFYALTKLIGEFIVNRLPRHLIIRTNFVTNEKWPYPKAFTDRFGTYLFADDLAMAIREVIGQRMEGLVHIVGDRKLSMYELAKLTTPDVEPMTLAEYHGPPLTIDMTLNTVRWKKYSIGVQASSRPPTSKKAPDMKAAAHSQRPRVSIVLLNWNNVQDSIECLESLKRVSYPNYRVIVLDNASKGNDVEILRAQYGDYITLIQNNKNYGYAGGNNIGICKALEEGPDYVLLLQNDAIVDQRLLDELVEVAESDQSIGMAFPLVFDYHDRTKIQFAGLKVVWGGLRTQQLWREGDDDRPQYSILGGPGCMFLRADKLNQMRWMEATGEYFMYGDLIYSFVVQGAGLKICMVPKTRIWHKGGSSSKVWKSDRIGHVVKDNLVIRWRFLFSGYFLHMPLRTSIYFLLWSFVYHLPGGLRFFFRHLRLRTVGSVWEGFMVGLRQSLLSRRRR